MLYKPDYVIHTAALKRVDDSGSCTLMSVKTNIAGSENVAISSLLAGVRSVCWFLPTKPASRLLLMGLQNSLPKIFTNYDHNSNLPFASVRYGNVIASRGSFIPLWMAAVSRGETINVTSNEMTRFLFTLEDAVDTVLDSPINAYGGEVFIPKIDSYTLPKCVEAIGELQTLK